MLKYAVYHMEVDTNEGRIDDGNIHVSAENAFEWKIPALPANIHYQLRSRWSGNQWDPPNSEICYYNRWSQDYGNLH